MTLLSNHISIGRPHFGPLLKKAVGQALLVIFDPYDFYSMVITGKDNKLDVGPFREEIKYLKVNKAPLEKMLQKLDEKGVTEISGNEAFSILDLILEEVSFTPEDVEGYLEKFSAVIPLDPTKFYVVKPEDTPPPAAAEKKPESPAIKSKPVFVPEPQKTSQRPTLNDTLTRQGRPTLASNFQRVGKIRDSLTINQKFMFTKVLFHGDFELFSQAIDHLDKMDTKKAALRYIENEHASAWDHESDEFQEFMDLVEKRFN